MKSILAQIIKEVERAEAIYPRWPEDPIHAAAIIAEESGEIVKACIDFTYDNGTIKDIETEAIQTAAMCIRFLEHMVAYERINTLK